MTVRFAPGGIGNTLVWNMPVPTHSSKAGITILADDLFVAPAGFLFRQQLRLVFFPVHQQRQPVDRAVVRQRKHEAHFHRHAARVLERLRDLHARDLIGELGIHFERVDLVARCGLWRLGDASVNDDRPRQTDRLIHANVDQYALC